MESPQRHAMSVLEQAVLVRFSTKQTCCFGNSVLAKCSCFFEKGLKDMAWNVRRKLGEH